jgi:hypothetical protein
MDLLDLPGWRIEYDRGATVAAYASTQTNGPEACGCDPCRNWATTRDGFFPRGFRELLDRLGVPFDGECEVYHNCRLKSGLHSYGGWYHFVGRVLSGEREGSPHVVFGPFSVFFHSSPALLPEAFAGQPVVQLEIVAEVPWLSGVPEAP